VRGRKKDGSLAVLRGGKSGREDRRKEKEATDSLGRATLVMVKVIEVEAIVEKMIIKIR